ncbi:MAG: MBL fold metallo-hydrolase [Candidatus Micrarchaeaceae archaeon]|nr:hypothetical protein [Candidatus Micrarchaeota archaeon]HII10199.1 hypothetical protein [Candidatus Micrarchaeota archaeon]
MISSNNLRISLDRKESGADIDFISHAHTDHIAAAKSSKSVLASMQTIRLIEQAHNITLAQGRNEQEGFRLIEAGHMLGSRQLCIENEHLGKRVVYTGDFQMVRSKTSRPIEILDADTVIMDSTYEDPSIRFNDKNEVETAMQDWARGRLEDGIVIFGAYALGKAQELISILNDAGIRPVVSKKIGRVSGVYTNNGIKLEYLSAEEHDGDYEDALRGNFVGITETRDLQTIKAGLGMAHGKRVFTAVATGFAKVFRFNTDAQFPLSDHADFSQSIEYIEATGAREVVTYGANAEAFARNLSQKGYNSTPFRSSAFAAKAENNKYLEN